MAPNRPNPVDGAGAARTERKAVANTPKETPKKGKPKSRMIVLAVAVALIVAVVVSGVFAFRQSSSSSSSSNNVKNVGSGSTSIDTKTEGSATSVTAEQLMGAEWVSDSGNEVFKFYDKDKDSGTSPVLFVAKSNGQSISYYGTYEIKDGIISLTIPGLVSSDGDSYALTWTGDGFTDKGSSGTTKFSKGSRSTVEQQEKAMQAFVGTWGDGDKAKTFLNDGHFKTGNETMGWAVAEGSLTIDGTAYSMDGATAVLLDKSGKIKTEGGGFPTSYRVFDDNGTSTLHAMTQQDFKTSNTK